MAKRILAVGRLTPREVHVETIDPATGDNIATATRIHGKGLTRGGAQDWVFHHLIERITKGLP